MVYPSRSDSIIVLQFYHLLVLSSFWYIPLLLPFQSRIFLHYFPYWRYLYVLYSLAIAIISYLSRSSLNSWFLRLPHALVYLHDYFWQFIFLILKFCSTISCWVVDVTVPCSLASRTLYNLHLFRLVSLRSFLFLYLLFMNAPEYI